jgi:hypothetical protein
MVNRTHRVGRPTAPRPAQAGLPPLIVRKSGHDPTMGLNRRKMEADRKAKAVSCLRGRDRQYHHRCRWRGRGAVKRGPGAVVLVKGLWVAACRSIPTMQL